MKEYGVHWFRRDLRIVGNPALQWSWKEYSGRVVGIFCFDGKFLSRPDFSANRFAFFLKTLEKLRGELVERGSDLLFLDVGPLDAFPKLFEALESKRIPLPQTLSWNRDYEPFARDRDRRVQEWLEKKGVRSHHERDHLLLEPTELYKGDDPAQGYQVYTPFSRRWADLFHTVEVESRVLAQAKSLAQWESETGRRPGRVFSLSWRELGQEPSDLLAEYGKKNVAGVPLPEAGAGAAIALARSFGKRMANYAEARDIPSVSGTSGLSVYFKNGSLTGSQVIALLGLRPDPKGAKPTGPGKFLGELIWREFYYHVLWRHPECETKSFLRRFDSIAWENREDWFEAWKAGRTGFPIVDAGMRQLKETGWMHNRVRMIVASFLTKDLLIDWRWGERYFMEQLLDGDLAPNNGGWQWAASTGCDPQPYFRIFNPVLQSKRFDPRGEYLRRYLPELSHLGPDEIHDPAPLERRGYPPPIVDHQERREVALRIYQSVNDTKR